MLCGSYCDFFRTYIEGQRKRRIDNTIILTFMIKGQIMGWHIALVCVSDEAIGERNSDDVMMM